LGYLQRVILEGGEKGSRDKLPLVWTVTAVHRFKLPYCELLSSSYFAAAFLTRRHDEITIEVISKKKIYIQIVFS
jgi:hypothetical protein